MRKIGGLIGIAIFILFTLCGCSQSECNHNYICYSSDLMTEDGKEQYHYVCNTCGDDYYKAIGPTVTFPEYIEDTANCLREIVDSEEFNIVNGSLSYGDYGVELIVAGENGTELEGVRRELTWYYTDDTEDNPGISFSMLFNTEEETLFIKEVLTAVIIHLDNCDYMTAQGQMQALVNTYSTYINSDLLQIGDWIIYFSQKNVVDLASLKFNILSEIENSNIDPSEYIPINFDMCQSPAMNKGTKFHFTGTVEIISYELMGVNKILTVLADDGNTYKVQVSYSYPVNEDTEYEFWVTLIDSDPCLSAHKLSPCNDTTPTE